MDPQSAVPVWVTGTKEPRPRASSTAHHPQAGDSSSSVVERQRGDSSASRASSNIQSGPSASRSAPSVGVGLDVSEVPGGRVLFQSIAQEANSGNKALRTAIVYGDVGRQPFFCRFPNQAVVTTLSLPVKTSPTIKNGMEGFTIGEIEIDDRGRGWRKFNIARTQTVGWVLDELLSVGQIATRAKVDLNLRSSSAGPMRQGGSVLQRTLEGFHAEMLANRDLFLSTGAPLVGFNTLGQDPLYMSTTFINGKP
jgi:hypothetical protein